MMCLLSMLARDKKLPLDERVDKNLTSPRIFIIKFYFYVFDRLGPLIRRVDFLPLISSTAVENEFFSSRL